MSDINSTQLVNLRDVINATLLEMMITWTPEDGADSEWEYIDNLYKAGKAAGFLYSKEVESAYRQLLETMPEWDQQDRVVIHPCLFDGADASSKQVEKVGLVKHHVVCHRCGASGPIRDTPLQAVDSWNGARCR